MSKIMKYLALAAAAVVVGVALYVKWPLPQYEDGAVFKDCDLCPEMVVIPKAEKFEMGEPKKPAPQGDALGGLFNQLLERPGYDAEPVHVVGIGRFAMGRTEVTQQQWQAIMGNNPSGEKECGVNCPVAMVNRQDIQEFIKRLNAKTGKNYRLPSEAEWEYAAAAGKDYKADDSSKVDASIWHAENSDWKIHPVGQKQANAFGLHDMLGNVWEWVEDCYHPNYVGAPTNGQAWLGEGANGQTCNKGARIVRGGSCIDPPRSPRHRGAGPEDRRAPDAGFRLARAIE